MTKPVNQKSPGKSTGPSRKEMVDWLDMWIKDKDRIRKMWEKYYAKSDYFRHQLFILKAIRDIVRRSK